MLHFVGENISIQWWSQPRNLPHEENAKVYIANQSVDTYYPTILTQGCCFNRQFFSEKLHRKSCVSDN